MENKTQETKKIIKQELGLYMLFDGLESVHERCYGYIQENPKIKEYFDQLYNEVANELNKEFTEDIVEQYVVTICGKQGCI